MHLRTIQQIWVSILFLHWHLKIETLHLVTRQEAYLYFKLVHSFLPIKRKSYPVIVCPMYLSLLSIHFHTNDLATSSYNCFFSRWFSSWKNSCCCYDCYFKYVNGCSSRTIVHGCSSDYPASMVVCVSPCRCPIFIQSGSNMF